MNETYKELAEQWLKFRPDVKPWLEKNKKELCRAIGMSTGDAELIVMLMRLSNPTSWPDASRWSEWKDDLGRARDRAIRPFLEGESTETSELRIAVGMLASQYNQACETIYYLKRSLGQPRRHR
jgi:hypothetical protein